MRRLLSVCAGLFLISTLALAQGIQTGTLTGTTWLTEGTTVLPGVAVTVESPALQGKRTQSSSGNGDYVFKLLPPGVYRVTFELTGMKTVTRSVTIQVGGANRVDAVMQPAATESVVVTGEAQNVDKTAVHGSTYDYKEITQLPIGRTIDQVAGLSPGLTTNTANGGVQIGGALSYDNVFLVDGVDINDNLFGTPTNNLVIEEAIQETRVLTSGISAEYGRFTGGVINAITKSGGNEYHGSARIDLSNKNWQAITPYERANAINHPVKLNEDYSGTFGGKILTDRLWFFGAGRYFKKSTQQTLDITNQTYDQLDKEPRFEGKLTANIATGHSLQVAYTHSKEELIQTARNDSIEKTTLITPNFPTDLWVASYNGVLTPHLFASLQYSRKKFQFAGFGGTLTDIHDSPRVCFSLNCSYGQPYFDATDPEDRDNNQWAGNLNYFISSPKLGTHDLKVGGEIFSSISRGGNSQSATNYSIYNDFVTNANGSPAFDAAGHLIPSWDTGGGFLVQWFATRGAESTIRTSAVFLNDVWRIGNLTANLGARYEKVHGTGPEGTVVANSHAIVPRLGLNYDIRGDGRYTVSGTYAQYAGGYNPVAFNSITNVGNPNYVYYFYVGPQGQGYNFAPGYDLNNYIFAGGNFPTQNVSLANGLHSPRTNEFTVSLGGQVLSNAYAAVTYVNRDYKDFIEDFITIDQGTTDVVYQGQFLGTFDNKVYRNTNLVKRKYEAIQFQSRADVTRNLAVQVSYGYMIKYEGNAEEEASNQPFSPSVIGNNPEMYVADRNYPLGRLAGFERHKLRVLTNYNVPTHFGNFALGLIYSFDSGTPYSLRAFSVPFSAIQNSRNPGYASPPQTQTVYFGARGSQLFPSQSRFDLAFTYDIPVFKTLSPWVKLQAINFFNTQYRTGFNTTIIPCTRVRAGCPSAPLDADGLPTTYTTVGTQFGQTTGNTQFQQARTFSIAGGIRF